jgi:hypothetical protein
MEVGQGPNWGCSAIGKEKPMPMDMSHIEMISSFKRFQKHRLRNTEIKLSLTSFVIIYENTFLKYFKGHSA